LEYNTERKKLKIIVLLPNYRYHFDNPMPSSSVLLIIEELLREIEYRKHIRNFELALLDDNSQKGIPQY
jgi:hypothetical protein